MHSYTLHPTPVALLSRTKPHNTVIPPRPVPPRLPPRTHIESLVELCDLCFGVVAIIVDRDKVADVDLQRIHTRARVCARTCMRVMKEVGVRAGVGRWGWGGAGGGVLTLPTHIDNAQVFIVHPHPPKVRHCRGEVGRVLMLLGMLLLI
jgi:hypothetical protein